MWSFGALFADFFTPLRFVPEDEVSDDGYTSEDDDIRPLLPHIMPNDFWRQRGYWRRDSLFDAERGSIGLAWSIFKVKGTPNETNWPVSAALFLS